MRKDTRRPPNQYQLPMNAVIVNPMMPSLVASGPMMVPPPGMGSLGGMPPNAQPNMMGLPQFPKVLPGPVLQQPQSIKARIATIIRDKQRFVEMDDTTGKRILQEPLKALL